MSPVLEETNIGRSTTEKTAFSSIQHLVFGGKRSTARSPHSQGIQDGEHVEKADGLILRTDNHKGSKHFFYSP